MEEVNKGRSPRQKSRQSLAHVPSRSNTTTDITALRQAEDAKLKAKKTRGKSLGPGALEVLTESNINTLKTIPSARPRSILKPSIPLTPPKPIPSFDELRKKSSTKAKSPAKDAPEDLLIDFSTPGAYPNTVLNTVVMDADALVDPFSPVAKPHTDSFKGQAMREDEEEERRQAEKKAIIDRRNQRRKSLANRRVSFAPEATLHTWSVMELLEDSTTSSATNSTRRQSATTANPSPLPHIATPARPNERLSTPVEQQNGEVISSSPASQRDLHQRKRRRVSDPAQSAEDDSFSSPGDGPDSSPIRVEDSIDSESDSDGDTAMSLDDATQDTIRSSTSLNSHNSLDQRLRQAASLAGTTGVRHDEDNTDEEEDQDDQPMEIADGTVTHAFRQYDRNGHTDAPTDKENVNHFQEDSLQSTQGSEYEQEGLTMGMTMDMTKAVGRIMHREAAESTADTSQRRRSSASRRRSSGDSTLSSEETMEMTVAKGGILSYLARAQEDVEPVSDDEMTVEMTTAMDGIEQHTDKESSMLNGVQDTESMDMTVAAGGILPPIEEQTEPQSFVEDGMTAAMDMTRAMGAILDSHRSVDQDIIYATAETISAACEDGTLLEQQPMTRRTSSDEENQTSPMEEMRVMGDIVAGKQPLVEVADVSILDQDGDEKHCGPDVQFKLEPDQVTLTPKDFSLQMAPVVLETGSPTLKPRPSARRSSLISQSTTPHATPQRSRIESTGQTTPSKQLTPMPLKSASAKRTPVLMANITTRSASPKKLFAKEIQQRASPSTRMSPRQKQDPIFSEDANTGLRTPRVVLHAPKPHQHLRKGSSDVNMAKEGTGSPQVSQLLSHRGSIGETVPHFQLSQEAKCDFHLEDPQQIELEVEAERAEEHRRESGRFVMEQEGSEHQDENTTQNLRVMIESMTPKQDEKASKIKGRKSLAVGSAKGLLGKRPPELDEDDYEDSTPKRLRVMSREGSPIKKVHLPKPPTREETTGHLPKVEQFQNEFVNTPTLNQSPVKQAQSPVRNGRFREPPSAQKATLFDQRLDNVVDATDISTLHPEVGNHVPDEERLSLQEFLNMTNIHFIELSTTKRRHTMAQSAHNNGGNEPENPSQANFVAAATTLPLLELYQHATRELKSYVSSGRKVIRQIEAETFAHQPAIFKEYVDGRPDVRVTMDNQFRNSKTSARLQSKEGWYAWRGQLVEGLQQGLETVRANMEQDKSVLTSQQQKVEDTVPDLVLAKQRLDRHIKESRKRLQEIDSIDHHTLKATRGELFGLDQEVSRSSQQVSALQQQMHEKDEVLSQAAELRQEMNDQTREATRMQEEQDRWYSHDVSRHQEAVRKLEEQYGWKLQSVEEACNKPEPFDITLTLLYQNQLRFSFCPGMLQPDRSSNSESKARDSVPAYEHGASISLTYSPDDYDERHPSKLPTELKFFLELIQNRLQEFAALAKEAATCKTLLNMVAQGWKLAKQVADEIQTLKALGIVKVYPVSGCKLGIRLMLVQSDRSRVDVEFILTVLRLEEGGFGATTNVSAIPVHGSAKQIMDVSKTRKVQHALSKEVESKALGEKTWVSAVGGFQEWLQGQMQARSAVSKTEPTMSKESHEQVQQAVRQERAEPARVEGRRATTQSPQRSTTPKAPARSPLAPKTTNSKVHKKALPVPKRSVASLYMSQQDSQIPVLSQQKENVMAGISKEIISNMDPMRCDDVFDGSQPAIPPEVQEAMMYTPVKRRAGALRRSPI
ncbi:hypothetical protein LTR64_008578 [Lithohypha guttulata]|uniref:uncharacterized protein n=1 Tax=Lithohypha guttulata TaxID=1690604 RepID=UPI002DE08ADF|nr:hypothetical protein LTR51_001655 [Lithohypha guttulata]